MKDEFYNKTKIYSGYLKEHMAVNNINNSYLNNYNNAYINLNFNNNNNSIYESPYQKGKQAISYYTFHPYNSRINKNSFNFVFCCCETEESIIIDNYFDYNLNKQEIKDSILSSISSSLPVIVINNLLSILLLVVSFGLIVFPAFTLYGEIPIIGLLDLFGKIAVSVCCGLTVYFFINTIVWIMHFDIKYFLTNTFMLLLSTGLVACCVLLLGSKNSNPNGFNGTEVKFDRNNTLIL